MERIKNLSQYQKAVICFLAAMLVVFTGLYVVISARVGFPYMGKILLPTKENGNTVYSGDIYGKQASFIVSPQKSVTFHYRDKVYGPYTAKHDPTAVPEEYADAKAMTGVEVRDGDEVIFRGAVYKTGIEGNDLMFLGENGDFSGLSITVTMNNGTVVDADGNVVDPMIPSVGTILQLMKGPELTHKGEWIAWFLSVFISVITVISILFADELFRWKLAFRILSVDNVEPSDWELAGRYIGWTILSVTALILYIMGLK